MQHLSTTGWNAALTIMQYNPDTLQIEELRVNPQIEESHVDHEVKTAFTPPSVPATAPQPNPTYTPWNELIFIKS